MDIWFLSVSLILYLLALIFFFYIPSSNGHYPKWSLGLLWSGFALHALAIFIKSTSESAVPLTHPYGVIITFSWTVLGVGLFICSRVKMKMILFGMVLLTLFLVLYALHVGKIEDPNIQGIYGLWLILHVLFCFISYATFTLSFLSSSFYLFQDWQLKRKKIFSIFEKLPDLMSLEQLNIKTIWIGVMTLGLGLLFGFYWSHQFHGTIIFTDPKIIASLILWILYVFILWLHSINKLGSRKFFIANLISYVGVLFTFLLMDHLTKYYLVT